MTELQRVINFYHSTITHLAVSRVRPCTHVRAASWTRFELLHPRRLAAVNTNILLAWSHTNRAKMKPVCSAELFSTRHSTTVILEHSLPCANHRCKTTCNEKMSRPRMRPVDLWIQLDLSSRMCNVMLETTTSAQQDASSAF